MNGGVKGRTDGKCDRWDGDGRRRAGGGGGGANEACYWPGCLAGLSICRIREEGETDFTLIQSVSGNTVVFKYISPSPSFIRCAVGRFLYYSSPALSLSLFSGTGEEVVRPDPAPLPRGVVWAVPPVQLHRAQNFRKKKKK